MSPSREVYRVTLSNNQIIELQKDDVDIIRKALEDEQKSVVVTLPGDHNNTITIYTEHIVSIEATGLIRRGIGFTTEEGRK
jgi:hypothetical protein